MATINEPGRFDCMKKLQANPDMPYFTVMASDPTAPDTVRHWASKGMVAGVATDKVVHAYEVAADMEAWQAANPDKVKVPD